MKTLLNFILALLISSSLPLMSRSDTQKTQSLINNCDSITQDESSLSKCKTKELVSLLKSAIQIKNNLRNFKGVAISGEKLITTAYQVSDSSSYSSGAYIGLGIGGTSGISTSKSKSETKSIVDIHDTLLVTYVDDSSFPTDKLLSSIETNNICTDLGYNIYLNNISIVAEEISETDSAQNYIKAIESQIRNKPNLIGPNEISQIKIMIKDLNTLLEKLELSSIGITNEALTQQLEALRNWAVFSKLIVNQYKLELNQYNYGPFRTCIYPKISLVPTTMAIYGN